MDSRIDAAVATSGKIIVGRLLLGTDLITGLEDACRENGVKYAYLSMAMGLLKCVSYYIPGKSDVNKKIGIVYGDPIIVDEPVEMLCMQGTICQSENGYESHIHGTGAKLDGEIIGGHFGKGGNIVMATIDFVLCETEGVKLTRAYEEETDFVMLKPIKE